MDDEAAIRTLIEAWASAVRDRDMDRILAHHGDDMLMYDVPAPLLSRGMAGYRATWDLFFQYSTGGPRSFNVHDIAVTAGDRVAFATAIIDIFDTSLRLTMGLRKDSDQWLIVHEHHSYPVKLGD